jgi:hypothetical protein
MVWQRIKGNNVFCKNVTNMIISINIHFQKTDPKLVFSLNGGGGGVGTYLRHVYGMLIAQHVK